MKILQLLKRQTMLRIFAFVTLMLLPFVAQLSAQGPPAWVAGDVFVAIGNSQYQVFHNAGTPIAPNYILIETLNDLQPSGYTTGCALDSSSNLYTTNFSNNKVVKFDANSPHSILQTIDTTALGSRANESVVFAANGDFFVGHADGDHLVHRYNAAGVLQQTYAANFENRGSDWVNLSSDQHTLFYTSEGTHIKRFDLSANAGTGLQLPDFATLQGPVFALRLLPPGDGSGGLLIADSADIKRLNGLGSVVQTYPIGESSETTWFALNLDPDGTSFWSGSLASGNFYKFDIATGNILAGPIPSGATNTGVSALGGICVKSEPAALNTVTLNYAPSATPETQIATFGQPTDPAATSLAITLNSVINPITVTVQIHYEPTDLSTGTPGVGIADGVCELGATEDQDFDCRLAANFTYPNNGILPPGDRLVPHIIPSHDNLGVWFRVTATVVSTGLPAVAGIDYTGPVDWYYAWNTNPSLVGSSGFAVTSALVTGAPNPAYPPGWNNQNPQMYDRPGENPLIDFIANITTFSKLVCNPTCVGTADPGVGGRVKTLNDIMGGDPPNPPTGTATDTVEFLVPVPGISPFPYRSRVPMLVAFELENESKEKSDPTALTPPHSVHVATFQNVNGVDIDIPVQYPAGFPTTFIYNPFFKAYFIFLSPVPYKTDGTVYTLQIDSDLFPTPVTAKFVVKKSHDE